MILKGKPVHQGIFVVNSTVGTISCRGQRSILKTEGIPRKNVMIAPMVYGFENVIHTITLGFKFLTTTLLPHPPMSRITKIAYS